MEKIEYNKNLVLIKKYRRKKRPEVLVFSFPWDKEAIPWNIRDSYSNKEAIVKQTNKTNIELLEIKEDNELTQTEIAEMLEISINTVKSYLCNQKSSR